MSIDLPALRQLIVDDLVGLVSEEEGLTKYSVKVEEALNDLSRSQKFNVMYSNAVNDTHVNKVIAHIIADYMLKHYLKDRINITLSLED